MFDKILVIDNESETLDKLIETIQSLNVGVDSLKPNKPFNEADYRGIVISGGFLPKDSYKSILAWYRNLFETVRIPVLGICLGLRIIGYCYGARISKLDKDEKGVVTITFHEDYPILSGQKEIDVYEDHVYTLITTPEGFENYGSSKVCKIQAVKHIEKSIYAVQFHPEICEGNQGRIVLENFVRLCLG